MTNLIAKFRKDQSGATPIECGVIASMIAVTLVFSLSAMGNPSPAKAEYVAVATNTVHP